MNNNYLIQEILVTETKHMTKEQDVKATKELKKGFRL